MISANDDKVEGYLTIGEILTKGFENVILNLLSILPRHRTSFKEIIEMWIDGRQKRRSFLLETKINGV